VSRKCFVRVSSKDVNGAGSCEVEVIDEQWRGHKRQLQSTDQER
jgi:hypothetical protein